MLDRNRKNYKKIVNLKKNNYNNNSNMSPSERSAAAANSGLPPKLAHDTLWQRFEWVVTTKCTNRKIHLDRVLGAKACKVLIQKILSPNLGNILDRVSQLIIPNNQMGNAGADLIADLIKNPNCGLVVLDISQNKIN